MLIKYRAKLTQVIEKQNNASIVYNIQVIEKPNNVYGFQYNF